MRNLSISSEGVLDTIERHVETRDSASLEQDQEFGPTVGDIVSSNPRMSTRNVDVFYGTKHAIIDVSLDIGSNEVIAMIGPSGCGKSTFLRCLNRMNDTIESCRVTGSISLDG